MAQVLTGVGIALLIALLLSSGALVMAPTDYQAPPALGLSANEPTLLPLVDLSRAPVTAFPVETLDEFIGRVGPAGRVTIPGVGEVILSPHAVERHGRDAWIARLAAVMVGPGGRWECKGGKEYIVTRLAGYEDRWTVQVLLYGQEKTAFVSTRNYVLTILEDDHCSNKLQYTHP